MKGYTVARAEDAPDVLGDYPGEMRLMTYVIDAEQAAITYRRMPQHTGGKGSYGHYHRTQEEIYFVMSGKLQFKLGDDVVELEKGGIVRVAPETPRSVWNEEPGDAELVIVSARIEDPGNDAVTVPDFWPV
jgi:mannose-6-phosphate isomerase-like protein (cupin superfamily)